jgi:hypothetical protein
VKTLHQVASALARRDPSAALFPATHGTVSEQLEALQQAYRQLVVLVHPDRNPRDVAQATAVLARLNALRDEREQEIRDYWPPKLPSPKRSGGIVRRAPAPLAVPDDGYDDHEPPPLPACPCVQMARATLPGRVIFCTRGGQDWAVRASDQKIVPIEHSWGCSRYRQVHPTTTIEHGITMQGPVLSIHAPGWCWAHDRLTKKQGRDFFG